MLAQHYQDSLNDVPTLNYRKVLFLKGRDVVPIYRASHMYVSVLYECTHAKLTRQSRVLDRVSERENKCSVRADTYSP